MRCSSATDHSGKQLRLHTHQRDAMLKATEGKSYLAHQDRMPYADLRRRDLDIGTGAVEGTVRDVVGNSLDVR